MPMSKKHYEADAAAINAVLWKDGSDPLTVGFIIIALSDIRALDNERFDRARWIKACTNNPSTK